MIFRSIIILWLMILHLFCIETRNANCETGKTAQECSTSDKMSSEDTFGPSEHLHKTHEQDQPDQPFKKSIPIKRHHYSFAIGAVYWPNLARIQPSQEGYDTQQFGQFEEWGLNIELAYHYHATEWLDRDLWTGIDFGLFYNENKGRLKQGGNIASRGMYLTPSLRWFMLGHRGSSRVFLGAGAGFYLLDFTEMLPFGEGEEVYEEGSLGGYISCGLRMPVWKKKPELMAVVLETKVHEADFGELAASSGKIKGPIYIFQLGFSF